MHVNITKKSSIKWVMACLILTLMLGVLISGCTESIEEDPIGYCEKHDCTYCERDNDCTAMHFFEKMICCQSLIDKHKAINIESFNKKTELESKWYKQHCLVRKCKGDIVLAPLPLPKVQCINNTCTPFSPGPEEICTDNLCTWNASWIEEQEERIKRGKE